MKSYLINLILRGVATVVKRISPSTRAAVFMLLIDPLVQQDKPERALRFLFELENRLYQLEGQTSVRYGGGIHTKHRHTNYHQFFIKNLKPGERALDVGSGNGFLAYDVVTSVKNIRVVGIELNKSNIKFACEHYQHPNLVFIHGDVLKNIPEEKFDVVILSNVLEHIEYRVDLLKKLTKLTHPKRLLIRVPQYDRDWRVPLKDELGVGSRLNKTHFIEYIKEKLLEELSLANLRPTHMEFRWGEIWSIAEPLLVEKNNG